MNIKKENKEKKGGNGSIDLSVPTSSSSTTSSPAPSPTYPKPRSSSIDKDHKDYKEQREQKEQKQKSPNTIKHVIVAADTTGSSSGPNSSSGCRSSDYVPPTINAVITISPRKGNTQLYA